MGSSSSTKRHPRPITPQVSLSPPLPPRLEQSAPVSMQSAPSTQSLHPFRWSKGPFLGRGAYGQVYKCQDLDSGADLVVKEVRLEGRFDQAQRDIAALKREIITLKTLQHRRIVHYLHTEVAADQTCVQIFMEYVPGGSLSAYIKRNGPIDEETASQYMEQLTDGLVYLHSQGVIHRDIKPENILIDAQGGLKLTDFGAARRIGLEEASMAAKSLIGSPYWMAPEVARRSGHSFPSDIWSLGCVLIEILSGKPPWSEVSQQAIAVLKLLCETERPPAFPSSISLKCKSFLYRCLRLEANSRATAQELRLHPFITGEELALEHENLLAAEEADKEPKKPDIIEDSSLYDMVYDLADIPETGPQAVVQPVTRIRSRQTLSKQPIEVLFESQSPANPRPSRFTVRLLVREPQEYEENLPGLNYSPEDVIAQTKYAEKLRRKEEERRRELQKDKQRRLQEWESELKAASGDAY